MNHKLIRIRLSNEKCRVKLESGNPPEPRINLNHKIGLSQIIFSGTAFKLIHSGAESTKKMEKSETSFIEIFIHK